VTVGQLTRIGQELASFPPTDGGVGGAGTAGPLRGVLRGVDDAPGAAPVRAAGAPGPGAPALTSGAGATRARMVLPKTVAMPIVDREIMPRATAVRVLSGTRGSIQSPA
jgi:hypothetical protein